MSMCNVKEVVCNGKLTEPLSTSAVTLSTTGPLVYYGSQYCFSSL